MKKLPKKGLAGVTYYLNGKAYRFINGAWWLV